MGMNLEMIPEEILRHVCACSFDKVALIDISSGEYQMWDLKGDKNSPSTGIYREYVISLAEDADKEGRAAVIERLSVKSILAALDEGERVYRFAYIKKEGGNYEQAMFLRFGADGLLAVFEELAFCIKARQEYLQKKCDKIQSQLKFLLKNLAENFFIVNLKTHECEKVDGKIEREQKCLYENQLCWFADHMVPEEDRQEYLENFNLERLTREMRANDGACFVYCTVMRRDGAHHLKIINALITDQTDEQEYMYSYAVDISGIKKEEEKNKQLLEISQKLLAITQNDSLTGLYNKETAEAFMKEHLEKDEFSAPGALLIIDIDSFKSFNDTYGHQIGDQVIQYVGGAMKEVFRSTDILCRWGGDEFCVWMKNTKSENIIQSRMKRLMLRVSQFQVDQTAVPITLSIGAAVANRKSRFAELFKAADKALYQTKQQGKNGYNICW